MNKLHNTLENIVFSMIEFNREIQSIRPNIHLPVVDYARAWQTVAFNPGRQVGKTTLIARHIGKNDIAISFNGVNAKALTERIAFFNVEEQQVINVHNLTPAVFRGDQNKTFDIVWVDEPSVMNKEDIQKIYETFAGICKQFVFIG